MMPEKCAMKGAEGMRKATSPIEHKDLSKFRSYDVHGKREGNPKNLSGEPFEMQFEEQSEEHGDRKHDSSGNILRF